MDEVQPIKVEARDGFSIWLAYSDGASGELDLSALALRRPFQRWQDRDFFEGVHLTKHRTIAWDEEIELCADALYSDLTGMSLEEMYPLASDQRAHA